MTREVEKFKTSLILTVKHTTSIDQFTKLYIEKCCVNNHHFFVVEILLKKIICSRIDITLRIYKLVIVCVSRSSITNYIEYG